MAARAPVPVAPDVNPAADPPGRIAPAAEKAGIRERIRETPEIDRARPPVGDLRVGPT